LKAVDYAGNESSYSNVRNATVIGDPRLERSAGVYYIPVNVLPDISNSARIAWNTEALSSDPSVPTDGPVKYDQAWFYTGTLENPTGQRVFIADTVSSPTSHTWDRQEQVIDGDLLVSETVTANKLVINDTVFFQNDSGTLIIKDGAATSTATGSYTNTTVNSDGTIGLLPDGTYQLIISAVIIDVPVGVTASAAAFWQLEQGYVNFDQGQEWGYRVRVKNITDGGAVVESKDRNQMQATVDQPSGVYEFGSLTGGKRYSFELLWWGDETGTGDIVLTAADLVIFTRWR